jgi:hypothetical protein
VFYLISLKSFQSDMDSMLEEERQRASSLYERVHEEARQQMQSYVTQQQRV